jgi:uncharacterized protein (DUF433 family)
MEQSSSPTWKHLEPRAKSAYRQLFLKGTRIRARIVYGLFMSEEEPLTPEEIAADYNLPVEAVKEAIAYCESKPPEIEEDFRREEARVQARMRRTTSQPVPPSLQPLTAEPPSTPGHENLSR